MSERSCKVLLYDCDPDALIKLQQVLENAGVDTTITWDAVEAQRLIAEKSFDLLLVSDHVPEFCGETTVRERGELRGGKMR